MICELKTKVYTALGQFLSDFDVGCAKKIIRVYRKFHFFFYLYLTFIYFHICVNISNKSKFRRRQQFTKPIGNWGYGNRT